MFLLENDLGFLGKPVKNIFYLKLGFKLFILYEKGYVDNLLNKSILNIVTLIFIAANYNSGLKFYQMAESLIYTNFSSYNIFPKTFYL